MNTIDIIYIIATAGALIGGFMTGFLSKVSSIVGIVFGIFNAIVLQESASKMLQDATELSETNATIIAFAALLIVSFIVVKIVAAILAWILDVLHLGIINKLAGALLSGIVTLVIVTAIIDVTSLLAPENRYTGKTVQQGSTFYNKIANDVYKDVIGKFADLMHSSSKDSSATTSIEKNTTETAANNNPGLLYKGTYTISGQGYNETYGYTNGADEVSEIEIYEEFIIIDGIQYDYISINDPWRTYKGWTLSSGLGESTDFYKVNMNTFEMIKYCVTDNQYGDNTWYYEIKNGATIFNRHSNNNLNDFVNYSDVSSSTNNDTYLVPNHYKRDKKECTACDGKGWIPSTRGVASFGQEKWCHECGKYVEASHYHETCPSCKGEGEW